MEWDSLDPIQVTVNRGPIYKRGHTAESSIKPSKLENDVGPSWAPVMSGLTSIIGLWVLAVVRSSPDSPVLVGPASPPPPVLRTPPSSRLGGFSCFRANLHRELVRDNCHHKPAARDQARGRADWCPSRAGAHPDAIPSTSGDGELLGVSLCDPSQGPINRDRWKSYATQWGNDPTWQTEPLDPYPNVSDLGNPPNSEYRLSLDRPAPGTVNVAGFDVQFDEERQLWFSDFTITTSTQSYSPFVRLALVRYQPHALPDASSRRSWWRTSPSWSRVAPQS
jgi:hypothetical protein